MFDELFEKWWKDGNYEYYYKSSKQIAKFAWNAAIKARENKYKDEEREDFLSAMESYPYD